MLCCSYKRPRHVPSYTRISPPHLPSWLQTPSQARDFGPWPAAPSLSHGVAYRARTGWPVDAPTSPWQQYGRNMPDPARSKKSKAWQPSVCPLSLPPIIMGFALGNCFGMPLEAFGGGGVSFASHTASLTELTTGPCSLVQAQHYLQIGAATRVP